MERDNSVSEHTRFLWRCQGFWGKGGGGLKKTNIWDLGQGGGGDAVEGWGKKAGVHVNFLR
jgi:hypothetical protein